MDITKERIVDIFYLVDEFCVEFDKTINQYSLGNIPKKKPKMSMSEVITILTLFHIGSFKNLKSFYLFYVQKHMKDDFPNTVSYNRFTELCQQAVIPMTVFLKTCRLGDCTGISFVDSTPIRVCKNKRIFNHKVFNGLAERGKCSMGFFFGFKLHLIINDKGEIISFCITPGNVDDRTPLKDKAFIDKIKGKLYGDKGYISKKIVETLFIDGLHLVTGIKNRMKNVLMEMKDKVLLRKRSVIETVNDELKNICSIEHSRHRSFGNFLSNMISALIAYSFFPKKPSIKYDVEETDQIALF